MTFFYPRSVADMCHLVSSTQFAFTFDIHTSSSSRTCRNSLFASPVLVVQKERIKNLAHTHKKWEQERKSIFFFFKKKRGSSRFSALWDDLSSRWQINRLGSLFDRLVWQAF